MSLISRIALRRAIILAPVLTLPLAAPPVHAQSPVASSVEGSWTGQFAQSDFTFEFTLQDGVWSGRDMSSRTNNWHDLNSVVVSGDSVQFSIQSEPVLSFVLTVDSTGRSLSGVAKIPNGLSVPFSATRRP